MPVLLELLKSYDSESLGSLMASLQLEDSDLPKDEKIEGILDKLRKTSGIKKHLGDEALFMESLRITADLLKVENIDWDETDEEHAIEIIYRHFRESVKSEADRLNTKKRLEIEGILETNLKGQSGLFKRGGAVLVGVAAGEAAGFGLYTGTAVGLKALGTVIGVTFPFGVYQVAMQILGIVVGPVGWVGGLAIFALGGWRALARSKHTRLAVVMFNLIIEYKMRGEAMLGPAGRSNLPVPQGVLSRLEIIDGDFEMLQDE